MQKELRKMRTGFTTGSCAAAAAKAAAQMLLTQKIVYTTCIETPAGVLYTPSREDIMHLYPSFLILL